jgi:hypothetical protein
MSLSPTATTQVCARIVGPLLLIVGAVVIARMDDLVLLIPAILQDGPLVFVTGLFTLICGLVLFAAHHHWSNPPAIAISLIGLLTILRGIILMFAPSAVAGIANQLLNLGPGAVIAGAVALLLGAWLSFVGWFAKRPA